MSNKEPGMSNETNEYSATLEEAADRFLAAALNMHETPKSNAGVGADILLEAHQLITGPRQASYGKASEDYAKVIDIFAALTGTRLSLADAMLFMVAVKLARLRTNLEKNRLHHDSLLDALGYLALLNQIYQDLPFPRTVANK